MKRRQFITLLGGTAVTWSNVVRAQQPAVMSTIGFLHPTSPETKQSYLAAFHRGWAIQALSRVETLRSNIIGRKVKTIGCRR